MALKKKMKKKKTAGRGRRRGTQYEWASLSIQKLLDLRMCDLELSLKGTELEEYTHRVREELESRNLHFRPYFWISDDWFTPDETTGSAIPFYLVHPHLKRLERRMMGEVEGGTQSWCLMLLRHEVGHALDHAFLLHRRRRWQELFGLSSYSYPRFYRPNPSSRRHVQHLEYWYAQSHPDEDFAETFAVWLKPRFNWRKHYQGWPVLKKLEYVDALMQEIAGKKPLVRTRAYVDSLPQMRKTLREHYALKTEAYGKEYPSFYDRDLCRLFSGKRGRNRRVSASAFIRRVRPEIIRLVARWNGEYRYHFEHVLKDMTGRCRELRLYVKGGERQTIIDFAIILTKHTMNTLYRNRRWVEM
jgi:hypothetical protein